MTDGRRSSRTARFDDSGVVVPIAALLLLAAAVTLFAEATSVYVPRWGAESEDAWDAEVARAMTGIRASLAADLATLSPSAAHIPAPKEGRALDLVFLGKVEPLPPAGTLSFEPDCGSFAARHALAAGATVVDVERGSRGCLSVRVTPSYGRGFAYVIEHGALLRAQSDGAAIVAGPGLEVQRVAEDRVHVALAIPALAGEAGSVTSGAIPLTVDLAPVWAGFESATGANAARIEWKFETSHPAAWRTWLREKLEGSGLVAWRPSPAPGESAGDYWVGCLPVDCSVGPGGRGRVDVRIEGPRVDGHDVDFALTYGVYRLGIG